MTKSSRSLAPVSDESGQISIFFSASLVVLITIIAFVINVGLFVKAKINLQNATDASAFAGAAVQARQLSTIAYMNWEMRNVYKEWMFKYYVVGNLNIQDVENPAGADNNTISFRLQPTKNVLESIGPLQMMNDPFNFPSVCIHLAGSQTNLCKRYSVPGLPEFGSTNLPGAEEASRAFINSLIGTKILDCVEQTRLNLLVNLTWAYNVLSFGDETIIDQGPQILADRQGAWPKAVEVAMRIRNLEYAVNRPPQTSGVCAGGSTQKTNCRTSITEIQQEKNLGNERIVKAFMSGYKNLGNDIEDEMKTSFTLTEIPPKVPDLGQARSASYLLVPSTKAGYPKQYLDLQLMMVNYATFYNAFVPRSTGAAGTGAKVSGACDVSKVAMPVPGYPLGYYKNPDVLTYYAVRGESEFKGMFNPFGSDPVKLTSYSAAKPFGGRIGPRLFFQAPNSEFFVGRNRPKLRSIPYIASLDFVGTLNFNTQTPLKLGDFSPGIPLPINFQNDYFWLKDETSALGGYTPDVQFGIPNMVYDYQTPFSDVGYTDATEKLNMIHTANSAGQDRAIGLFSKNQMMMFKGNALNAQVDQQTLEKELARIKAPTLYETANYMVPSPEELNAPNEMDSIGFIPGQGVDQNGIKTYRAFIYAPLYSDNDQADVFWRNGNEVVSTVFEFLRAQKSGIDKYKRNMIQAAIEVDKQGLNLAAEAAGARANFTVAAQGIADVPNFAGGINQPIQSCKSLAGLFLYFYFGDGDLDPNIVSQPGGCPQTLGANLKKYFSNSSAANGYSPTHYLMEYSYNPAMKRAPMSLFTAYMPGPYTGVGANGIFNNAIPGVDSGKGDDNNMRRNFYSTKFVGLTSLQATSNFDETLSNFPIYSEGKSAPIDDTSQKLWRNPLDTQQFGGDINAIRY